jgi:hypothetical protein
MANAVYKRIFDDVFMMTSAEKRIRSSVFALYFGENTSDVSLWGLCVASGGEQELMVQVGKAPSWARAPIGADSHDGFCIMHNIIYSQQLRNGLKWLAGSSSFVAPS